MKKTLGVFLLLILVISGFLGAEPPEKKVLPSLKAAQELNQQFLQLIVSGEIEAAFGLVKPYLPIAEKEVDNLKMVTIQQYQMLEPSFGKSLDFKLVEKKEIADSLVRFTYLEIREKLPLRWTIIYYRPQVVWFPVVLKWDAHINDLF